MFDYSDLVGLPYDAGKRDCFSLVRGYYEKNFDLKLPNFARPTRFWEDPNLDLYAQYREFGFELVMDKPLELGDAVLMPLLTPMPTHAAVIVDDNRILHHLPNQLSRVDDLRPRWSARVTTVLRHPHITSKIQQQREVVHLHEVADANVFKNPDFQKAVEQVLEPERREMRGDIQERKDRREGELIQDT